MNGKSPLPMRFLALTIAAIGVIMALIALLAAAVQMVVLLTGVSLIILAAVLHFRRSKK